MTCRAIYTTAAGRELTCTLPSNHTGPHRSRTNGNAVIAWNYSDEEPTDADQ